MLVGLALLLAVSAIGVVVGSAIVGRASAPLAGDPAGAEACGILDRWLREGRAEAELEIARRAAELAGRSSTEAIHSLPRGVADVLNSDGTCCAGFAFVDLHRLHRACTAAGVDLPPY